MENILVFFRRRLLSLPYRMKLFLVFSLLILLTAAILGSITYYQFAKSSQRKAEEYSIQLADQINRNLDRYIKEMRIISLSPLYDQEVLNILKNHQETNLTTSFPPASERVKIWRYISSLIHMRNEIRGIHIMANDGNIFSNLDSNTIRLKVFEQNNDWVQQITQADGQWVILPLHHPNYYLDTEVVVFSVARLIREPSTQIPLGMIKIDLKQQLIEEIVSNANSQSQIFIVNDKNEFIYPNQGDQLISPEVLTAVQNREVNNNTNIVLNGIEYLMVFNKSENTGLSIIMLTPKSEILSEVNDLRKVSLFVVLAGILIASILGFILSKPLVGSIHRLKEAMVDVEKGNFSQRVSIDSEDEIGELGKGFNVMMSEIDRLVSEVYKTSLREKDAELRALQSQMNPHFLYNTLESINMLAITKGNLEVSDMVSSLGKLLRYTIENNSKIVFLKEEVSFIRSYITIQKVRMGDKLQYTEDIPYDLLDTTVPKLMLQPIIENSIVHGLGSRGVTVTIQATLKEEKVEIVISDNGKGVDTNRLKELKQSLKTHESLTSAGHNGIALTNVHERIQLLYGNKYGLEIQSEQNKGFSVIVTLPHLKKGE
ncbi:sensor histidine kinase [Bacillus haimaensis]|uniref:sensor histidine kinase n=1 Tax=Bacillus haimaensis TaxID=3160967 RepID=UPI003AA9633D